MPNIQVATNVNALNKSLLAFCCPKVEAFCRLTISLSRGCRHFPGVWDAPDAEAGEDVDLGVDGRNGNAIEIYECEKDTKRSLQKRKKKARGRGGGFRGDGNKSWKAKT